MSKEYQVFNIYVDESSKNGHTYFAVGAILCEQQSAGYIESHINQLVTAYKHPPNKEIHWKDLKNSRDHVALYSAIGTSLISFTQVNPKRMRYSSLIGESRHILRDRSKGETIDDVIAKFVFTLVFQLIKAVGMSVHYNVYIDLPNGDERSDVRTLCSLNNEIETKLGGKDGPVKSVNLVRSEASRLIQATDLITGVVAYEMNGRHLMGAKEHKRKVHADMLAQSNLPTFAAPTTRRHPQFQIWHFDFSKSDYVTKTNAKKTYDTPRSTTRFKPILKPQAELFD
jgi:hypothetical protein